jgi:hypothetical protein
MKPDTIVMLIGFPLTLAIGVIPVKLGFEPWYIFPIIASFFFTFVVVEIADGFYWARQSEEDRKYMPY